MSRITSPPEIGRWLEEGRRCAAAVLIGTEGSAPLSTGAVMLIDEAGNIEGSLTGGCVESAVAQEALTLMAGGAERATRRLTYGISDELAGTAGLMCGGTVHIFLVTLTEAERRHLADFHAAVAADRPAGIALALDGEEAGTTMLLAPDEPLGPGSEKLVKGSFGAELFDRNVASDLADALRTDRTTIRRYAADGARLGSDREVFIHARAEAPQMLLVGAIDFSAALAPIARQLGYRVTIGDPRPAFAKAPRFSRAAEVVVGWPDAIFADRELGPADVVLVFSHDARLDVPALRAALATEAGFIGALGSRKTAADRNRRLREAGASEAEIERVFAPVGLDIGASSPGETAISILAEIIAIRSGRSGVHLREGSESIRPRRDPARA